jgi:hypothetical protein
MLATPRIQGHADGRMAWSATVTWIGVAAGKPMASE